MTDCDLIAAAQDGSARLRVPYPGANGRGVAATAFWWRGRVFISDGMVCASEEGWRRSPARDTLIETVGRVDASDLRAVLVAKDAAKVDDGADVYHLLLNRARLAATRDLTAVVSCSPRFVLTPTGVFVPRKYARLARYRWRRGNTAAGVVLAAFDENGRLQAVVEKIGESDVRD